MIEQRAWGIQRSDGARSCKGSGGSKSPSGVEGRSPCRRSEGRSTLESEAFNEFYRILKMPNEFYFEIYYFNFD